MKRRHFLAYAFGLYASTSLASTEPKTPFWDAPRSLHLKREVKPGVWEEVSGVYYQNGRVVDHVYRDLCRILRDTHTGKTVQMSLDLLDIMCGIQGWFESHGIKIVIVVTSGYREEKTNEDAGGRKDSAHLRGGACDFHIPGISVDYLQKVAFYLQGGGVGIYPSFLHVDDGRVRGWKGVTQDGKLEHA